MCDTISSNAFSADTQASDALEWLRVEHTEAYCKVRKEFPETFKWSDSWLNTEAMEVDSEYGSWLIDAIEATELVQWIDGEPYAICGDPDCECKGE